MTNWPPSKTEIAAFFNARAASYDRSDMHRWLACQTVLHMNLPQRGTFLDLGVGTGLALREIAACVDKPHSRFIAVDLASEPLAASKASADALSWKLLRPMSRGCHSAMALSMSQCAAPSGHYGAANLVRRSCLGRRVHVSGNCVARRLTVR